MPFLIFNFVENFPYPNEHHDHNCHSCEGSLEFLSIVVVVGVTSSEEVCFIFGIWF